MDGLMGSLLPTCDPHHCEMHSSPLQMSQDPEGVRDLSKVTKQKMAESEPLRPLLRAFMPTCPLSRFILLPPLSSSPPPPVPCASYQGSLQPSPMLWESLFLHPAWVFKEEVWRRRDSGLGTHCGLPTGSPIAFSTFLLIQSCSPPVNPHSVCMCTWGGVILPPLPQHPC